MLSIISKRKEKKQQAKDDYVSAASEYAWDLIDGGDIVLAAAIMGGLAGYSTRSLGAVKRRVWKNMAGVAASRGGYA